tara:strand:+ start:333 stop:575 length:243 start_codon:yes stop_codon:yes gene_type:complete
MKKQIYNPENPNGIIVDMTAEEISQKEKDIATGEALATAQAEAKAQKEADAKSGNQKFLDLGLTQAEATALTGYTPPVEE